MRSELDELAANAPYTPAAGLFADPQPSTAQEALDRMAAAVVAGTSGVIA